MITDLVCTECTHTILQHAIPEAAIYGDYDTTDPQPCTQCLCRDLHAFTEEEMP